MLVKWSISHAHSATSYSRTTHLRRSRIQFSARSAQSFLGETFVVGEHISSLDDGLSGHMRRGGDCDYFDSALALELLGRDK